MEQPRPGTSPQVLAKKQNPVILTAWLKPEKNRNPVETMFSFLDKTGYLPLVVLAVFLGLAPFAPVPHALEKISMLFNGKLTSPVDIFDLVFHLTPTILIVIKLARKVNGSGSTDT